MRFLCAGTLAFGSDAPHPGTPFQVTYQPLCGHCIHLEDEVPQSGLNGGARRILPDFNLSYTARGQEQIPAEGALLIACNHPGAYDSVVVTACIPRRDLKLVVSDTGFAHALTASSRYFIFIPVDIPGRMAALRACVQHLQSGGALLIFARGDVEPDPAIMAGAEAALQDWSPSIEIMLRKAPQTRLQVAIASGVILRRFIENPITKLRSKPPQRQKLAEFLQVIQQMLFPCSVAAHVQLSFDSPVRADSLPNDTMMPAITQRARQLLEAHRVFFNIDNKAQDLT